MFRDDIESVLVRKEQIQQKVRDLGAQITKDYAGKEVVLTCILRWRI